MEQPETYYYLLQMDAENLFEPGSFKTDKDAEAYVVGLAWRNCCTASVPFHKACQDVPSVEMMGFNNDAVILKTQQGLQAFLDNVTQSFKKVSGQLSVFPVTEWDVKCFHTAGQGHSFHLH